MKGQAWNVVETLKTPDHGPLELTRRARVYVWDDLVDVPVAVPLRTPTRSARRSQADEHGEIDISAARASAPQPSRNLVDLDMAKPDFSPDGQFNVSRQENQLDSRQSMENDDGPLSPDSVQAMAESSPALAQSSSGGYFAKRPGHKARRSYDETRRTPPRLKWQPRRHLSGSARSMSNAFMDDDEGDLGYTAAEDRESNQKKVIVERLEPVKSKTPFFTWC